jgi:hypothetical protein
MSYPTTDAIVVDSDNDELIAEVRIRNCQTGCGRNSIIVEPCGTQRSIFVLTPKMDILDVQNMWNDGRRCQATEPLQELPQSDTKQRQ